jgi:hypothetical protein
MKAKAVHAADARSLWNTLPARNIDGEPGLFNKLASLLVARALKLGYSGRNGGERSLEDPADKKES